MKRITVTNETGAIVARFDLEDAEAARQLAELEAPDSSFRERGPIEVHVDELDPDALDLMAMCHALRHANYPSIGDQLDALHKARLGDTAELERIDARIQDVKSRYPKPRFKKSP